ncbi:hypothetical protein OIO90_001741 [Microbotryomycetes sp. JL221]|nr:hypothetical protein OIO90_001741 [Microbotryomycetes sp. JL221]
MDDWLRQQHGLTSSSSSVNPEQAFAMSPSASGSAIGSPAQFSTADSPAPTWIPPLTRPLSLTTTNLTHEYVGTHRHDDDEPQLGLGTGAIAIHDSHDSFRQARSRHDANEYEDSFPVDDAVYGTPSYAGSWSSQYHADGLVATSFDHLYKMSQQQQQQQQLQQQQQFQQDQLHNPFESMRDSGFERYRDYLDPRAASSSSVYGYTTTDDESSSVYGGSNITSSNAGSVIGNEDATTLDFDLDNMLLDNARSTSASPAPQVPLDEQNSPFLRRRRDADKTLMAAEQPSTVSFMLSDSPPATAGAELASSSSFGLRQPSTRVNSPPTLAPLAIPSDGPSFNLIQPTPMTARPSDKQKGQNTLELERILGMVDWAQKDIGTSFSDFTPTNTTAQQAGLPLLSGADKFTSVPESYESSTVAAPTQLNRSMTPNFAGPAATRPPIRQRSRSEADIFVKSPTGADNEAGTSNASMFHVGSALLQHEQQQQQLQEHLQNQLANFVMPSLQDQSDFPGPPPAHPMYDSAMMHAASAWQHAAAGGFVPVQVPDAQTAMALSEQIRLQQLRFLQLQQQQVMALAAAQQQQQAQHVQGSSGNPGFDAALQLVEGHRRSRSQGPVHQDSFAGGIGVDYANELNLLAPPQQSSISSRQHRRSSSGAGSTSGSRRSSSSHMFEPSPTTTNTTDPSNLNDSQRQQAPVEGGIQTNTVPSFPIFPLDNAFDVPPPPMHSFGLSAGNSMPFVFRSPQSRQSSLSSVASGVTTSSAEGNRNAGGVSTKTKKKQEPSGPSKESRTTQATINAAIRRRNPNSAAKFVCDLCGESFTRRYNLKGHLRAHRNEKPYICSFEGCGKAFARSHDCKRHELLHLNVRRYHCEPCKRDFVRLDALQRHHRSEIGQTCVEALRAAGFSIPYDTAAPQVAL